LEPFVFPSLVAEFAGFEMIADLEGIQNVRRAKTTTKDLR
jgi:hypothetical protein